MPNPTPAELYLLEAEDLLARIEEIALELKEGTPPGDRVHQLFRAFHTIKGSGAMFGFDAVAAFTHHVETTLDQVREGAIPVTSQLIELILAARDRIKAMLNQPELAADQGTDVTATLAALSRAALAPAAPESTAPRTWRIVFRPAPDLFQSGSNPALLLNELRSLGNCEVRMHSEDVPPLAEMQPDRCYAWWTVRLETDRSPDDIRDVFLFVSDGRIEIEPQENTESAPPGAVVRAAAPVKPSLTDSTVRVPSERLDRLVNLVGELVVNQSRLRQAVPRDAAAELAAPVEEIERLVDELRDHVLAIRMTPIETTFRRFKRLVHDLSAEMGKEIDLITEGGETELDKTVLDQLADPLVHMVRNSIDHGIEPAQERLERRKPRRGTVKMTACHTGASVVVTIADDGRGLDCDAIRAKAVEKHLIAADARLSEQETFRLIFQPGFSTARQVTSVSGRGVGMDVVKRQIDALRGEVAIASEPGRGSAISLTLPLTLAIIDGLLVSAAGSTFIIPMAAVTENLEIDAIERRRHNGRNLIAVRGELIPYVRLRDLFRLPGEPPAVEKIVVVRAGDVRLGIALDRILGSHQTVIQPLGRFYRNIRAVSGATIMGDGRVTLILEIAGLAELAQASEGARAQ
jgi:two-component system chemotaxis sensor kinase CheA